MVGSWIDTRGDGEQIDGGDATPSTDLYAFGALVFELLTGRPPFEGSPAVQLLGHLTQEPRLPSLVAPAGWVAPDVDDFVSSLLNKDATHRPADAQELLGAIDALGSAPLSPEERITAEDLETRIRDLFNDPTDELAEIL